jgi:hypothetical protein
MRESLERLARAVASQADEVVGAAVVPIAGGLVGAGDELIESADEITDAIEEAVPGGGVINWAADIALLPGRFCIKVVRIALDDSAKR